MSSCTRILILALAALLSIPLSTRADTPNGDTAPIMDNSFLIEEAYNQEDGVVQHISSFARERGTGAWVSSFTQEWPAPVRRHQVSWTLLFVEPGRGSAGSGLGDVGVNYRYMVAGVDGGPVAFAPRASLFFPTGSSDEGRGDGGRALQVNLPLSLEVGNRVALHTNLGALHVWNARNEGGASADLDALWAGQSFVWLLRPSFNLLLEAVWLRSEQVVAEGMTERHTSLVISPGARFAINRPSGLQIVPGIAFPTEMRDNEPDSAVLLYLSFEHPFRSVSGDDLD